MNDREQALKDVVDSGSSEFAKIFARIHRELFAEHWIDRLGLITKAPGKTGFSLYGRVQSSTRELLAAQAEAYPPELPDLEGLRLERGPSQTVEATEQFDLLHTVTAAVNAANLPFLQLLVDHQPSASEAVAWRLSLDRAIRDLLHLPWAPSHRPSSPSREAVADSLRRLWATEGPACDADGLLGHISGILCATEEGKRPRGSLLILPARHCERLLDQLPWRFGRGSRPPLKAGKHVVKVLVASGTARANWRQQRVTALLSDGESLLGLYDGLLPSCPAVLVAFRSRTTYLRLVNSLRPEFYQGQLFEAVDGRFRLASASQLERTLFEVFPMLTGREDLGELEQALVAAVLRIQASAQRMHHGCSIVLEWLRREKDRRAPWESGHRLADGGMALIRRDGDHYLPMDDQIEYASQLAAMDGALHVDAEGRLVAFGCLMDGSSFGIPEHPDRGARFNSAKRFTGSRKNMLVVSVSEDGPATVFFDGQVWLDDAGKPSEYRELTADELTPRPLSP